MNKAKPSEISFKNIGKDNTALLNSVNDAVILMDGMNFIDCNEKALELYGCRTKDELLNAKPYELSPEYQPDGEFSKDAAMEKVQSALNGIPQFFEWKHTKLNNELIDTEVSLNCIGIKGNKNLIAVVRDITRRKKAEKINSVLFNISKATGESESLEDFLSVVREETNRLMDARNFYIALLLDREQSLYQIPYGTDQNPDEIEESGMILNLKNGFTDYVVQNETPLLANKYQIGQLFKNQKIELIGTDSESWLGVPLRSRTEGIIGVLAVQSYTDPNAYSAKDLDVLLTISTTIASAIVHKRSETSLKESESRFKKLSDAAEEGILFYDESEAIIDVNRAFLEMTGHVISDLVGTNISTLFHDTSYIALRKKGLSGDNNPIEVVLLTKSYSIIFCMSTVRNFDLSSGNVKVATFKDISSQKAYEKEKKILQEKLNQSEKMEALGRLAGGVAHDLNNVLTSIVSYPDLILMDITNKNKVENYILKLKKSGQKAAAIVEDLLTLTRRSITKFQPVNINTIITDFVNSSECEKIKKDYPKVKFNLNLQNGLHNIKGSKIHLTAMLMNLILNSTEAIKDKGSVHIISENLQNKDKKKREGLIKITVSDNGVGMSKEEKEKIFEPFYTKKLKDRSGTGLGMSVVWGTIQDHKGTINVSSKKGEGTRIVINFPATLEKIPEPKESIPFNNLTGNKEKILIVDDEAGPREIAGQYLQKLNYKIDKVSSGEDAVKLFKRKRHDLIILDMLLENGIDGLETFKKLSKIDSNVKAVIVSGFSETERVKEAQRMGAGDYIKKPYTFRELGLAVKKELER
ncbi:MAG: response regulator [Acidobacteriota bacterium]